jgi:hypothetical protein
MRLKILGAIIVLAISFAPWGRAAGTYQPPFEQPGLGCQVRESSCQTTCTGPLGVECCCIYDCPSGSTWVCHQGEYCSNTDRGCLF